MAASAWATWQAPCRSRCPETCVLEDGSEGDAPWLAWCSTFSKWRCSLCGGKLVDEGHLRAGGTHAWRSGQRWWTDEYVANVVRVNIHPDYVWAPRARAAPPPPPPLIETRVEAIETHVHDFEERLTALEFLESRNTTDDFSARLEALESSNIDTSAFSARLEALESRNIDTAAFSARLEAFESRPNVNIGVIDAFEGRLAELEKALSRGGFQERLGLVEMRLAGLVLRIGGQRHGGPTAGPVEAAPRGSD